jgi:nondiscriminating aspartyl-tRNA synthetase
MATTTAYRTFIQDIPASSTGEVLLRGWVYGLRVLRKTSFIILRDCSGVAQCVAATEAVQDYRLKVEDVVEVRGVARADRRSKVGFEIHILTLRILNPAGQVLPFRSADNVDAIGLDLLEMFELGMPPHGGFAIGLERLTCQVLNLSNVRQAVLYPRDRDRLTP